MTFTTNSARINESIRLNTRSSQPRTSANATFQEKVRAGLANTAGLAASALRHVGGPIPGVAALSAGISNAAKNLSGSQVMDLSNNMGADLGLDGTVDSLQNDMIKSNQELLSQQLRVSQITTSFNTKSNILKAAFDALKNIAQNIR